MQIRPMQRGELDVLVDWAAAEGWNPGLDDAEVFWSTDPEGFVAAEEHGELIGGGSIVAYDGYGFMGLFIVREDRRRHGLGRELWYARKELLRARLAPDTPIEMDGVFDMQAFYAAGGFVFQHRDLRFEGRATPSVPTMEVADLADVPFAMVEAYDRAHFPAPRAAFLRSWIQRPGGHALGVFEGDRCRGFGVSRPCRVGHKIGPLFADDGAIAEALFNGLTARIEGDPVFLDVPERNEAAMELARRHDLREVFGCARMTAGPVPAPAWDEIFGVTSFELG